MTNQKGFTLIELVMIIVIVAILAAIAVPRYVDMADRAESASAAALTGALRAAASINYANCVLRGTATAGINITSVHSGLQETGGLTISDATHFTATINGKTYTWTYTAPTQVGDGASS